MRSLVFPLHPLKKTSVCSESGNTKLRISCKQNILHSPAVIKRDFLGSKTTFIKFEIFGF
jgi:hypothetical protein